ncbi:hypothetical protein [Priestia filamentosa]|uniref:hypothetical protein n=1 Tax=Priestia filamentosa TaxID=1402861 RepID=UPI003982CFC3
MSMGYCIKGYRTSIDPRLLRTFFSHTKISITDYNWIFSDLTAYASKGNQKLEDSIFCQGDFILTGQELDELLKNEVVVVLFGVMVTVKENLNIKDIFITSLFEERSSLFISLRR